jgi:hypothetical protein
VIGRRGAFGRPIVSNKGAKMKLIHINSTARTIKLIDYTGLEDMQRLVGGYIELAKAWDSGDVCYVDEEGKMKDKTGAFLLPGVADIFVGDGVVVGREIDDTAKTHPPTITVEQLQREVVWMHSA